MAHSLTVKDEVVQHAIWVEREFHVINSSLILLKLAEKAKVSKHTAQITLQLTSLVLIRHSYSYSKIYINWTHKFYHFLVFKHFKIIGNSTLVRDVLQSYDADGGLGCGLWVSWHNRWDDRER